MRFLYVTDLHGDKGKYRKSAQIAKEKNIKLIVNGGDMLPKHGDRHIIQPLFLLEFLDPYFSDLQELGITYLCMPGNDDMICFDEDLENLCEKYDNVHYLAGRKVSFDGYEFIGMDRILDHPFGCKDRVVTETRYIPQRQLTTHIGTSTRGGYHLIDDWLNWSPKNLPKMEDELKKLPDTKDFKKAIYVMHMPPAGLGLGQLRSEDRDVGSWDIRDYFLGRQPLLSLHGHIHEAPDMPKGNWLGKLGGTTCIQPGQTEKDDPCMTWVEVEIDDLTGEVTPIRMVTDV